MCKIISIISNNPRLRAGAHPDGADLLDDLDELDDRDEDHRDDLDDHPY